MPWEDLIIECINIEAAQQPQQEHMEPFDPMRKVWKSLWQSGGIAALLAILLTGCNFPGFHTPQRTPPGGLDAGALRLTLQAQFAGTLTPGIPAPGGSETALPGEAALPPTPTPGELPTLPPAGVSPTPFISPDRAYFTYTAQPGDTLAGLAGRFGVAAEEIVFLEPVSGGGLLPAGLPAAIPNRLGDLPYTVALLPDREVVYSPSTAGFDLESTIRSAGGFLSTYSESVDGEMMSGVQIVARVALETSTHPRLLLALLDYQSGWLSGQPVSPDKIRYPFGFYVKGYTGLYKELSLAAKQLNIGYYGWRAGTLKEIRFKNDQAARLSPQLNAGTIALQFLFSKTYDPEEWGVALYAPGAFIEHYRQLFGDPWQQAFAGEPLFPPGLEQPTLELPFTPGERWSLTGGPHVSWNTGTPRGAVDFAPVTGEAACKVSRVWVLAAAPGLVLRSERGVVTLDLDGDGNEGTGWVLFYLHIAGKERIAAGTRVEIDTPLGHPSCEGGNATGTHVHLARKYNGEWIPAYGALPFTLSGWQVESGGRAYEGSMVKDGQAVFANPGGSRTSIIVR